MSTAGVLQSRSSLRAARPALRVFAVATLVAAQFAVIAGPAAAVPPTVSVTNAASPTEVPEPGGTVSYQVEVTNTAAEQVTLTGLSSSAFGDLLDVANSEVSDNTCPDEPTVIAASGTFACSFDAYVPGEPGDPDHVSTVTAQVENAGAEVGEGSTDATVSFADVMPTLTVDKAVSADWVPQPSGTVTFTVEVENTSPEEVTLAGLVDSVFGDLLDAGNTAVANNTCPSQGTVVASGASFTCSFDAELVGVVGDPDHVDTVTAAVTDDEANIATAGDTATVSFEDGSPKITVEKTPSVDVVAAPGGDVAFTIAVTNTSLVEVTLTSLIDSVFGDLLFAGNGAVSNSTCPTEPDVIAPEAVFTCTFDAYLEGASGDPDHVNTVTAGVEDAEANTATASDDATVAFGDPLGISGVVFDDLDADGVREEAEPGLAGVVILLTAADAATFSATTDEAGAWSAAVPTGQIDLAVSAESVPAGYELTTGNDTQTVDVPEEGAVAADIGYTSAGDLGSLSGAVFVDLDGDGMLTYPEPGVEGVTVRRFDGDGIEVVTAVTDAAGVFVFESVPAGEYSLEVDETTLPDGLVAAADARALEPGEAKVEDLAVTGTGSIGSEIWLDADGDGDYGAGEQPLPNAGVYLTWAGPDAELGTFDDWVFTPAVTDAAGVWRFNDLPPGRYAGGVDETTVGAGMQATTPVAFEVQLDAYEDFVPERIGFAPGDSALPQTGFGTTGMGFTGVIFLLTGLVLILAARGVEVRRRRLLLARLFWR